MKCLLRIFHTEKKKTEIKKKTTCSTHLVKIEMVAFSYRRINGTLKII